MHIYTPKISSFYTNLYAKMINTFVQNNVYILFLSKLSKELKNGIGILERYTKDF